VRSNFQINEDAARLRAARFAHSARSDKPNYILLQPRSAFESQVIRSSETFFALHALSDITSYGLDFNQSAPFIANGVVNPFLPGSRAIRLSHLVNLYLEVYIPEFR